MILFGATENQDGPKNLRITQYHVLDPMSMRFPFGYYSNDKWK